MSGNSCVTAIKPALLLCSTMPNILDGSAAGDDPCNDGCDQSTYDIAIAVDPDDAEEVITGGINIWRDEASGGPNMQIVAHWQQEQTAECQTGGLYGWGAGAGA